MVKNRQIRRLLTAGFCSLAVTFAAAGAGAAGDTFRQSAELGKRTGKTSEDVDKCANQLDKTEQALSSVSQAQNKDLKKRYESFSRQVIGIVSKLSRRYISFQHRFHIDQIKSRLLRNTVNGLVGAYLIHADPPYVTAVNVSADTIDRYWFHLTESGRKYHRAVVGEH